MVPPPFKPFNLALVQLGHIGKNKAENLTHARDMLIKAAGGTSTPEKKPNLIVLPVRFLHYSSFRCHARLVAGNL